jgi:hypothetical protein
MPGRVNERSGAVWDSDVAGMGTDSMTLVFAVASTRDGELKNDRCRFLADFHIRRCVYTAFQVADGTRYGSVTVAPILVQSFTAFTPSPVSYANMAANLQNLAGDVVLNILCYCDISGVLAVSQVCHDRLYSP